MFYLIPVLAILYAIICYKDIKVGALVFIALLPAYLLRAEYFGIPTTLLEVMLLVLFIVWLFHLASLRASHSERSNLRKTGIAASARLTSLLAMTREWTIPILLIFLAATIGLFIAPDRMAALGIYKAYFIEPILFFFLILNLLRDKKINQDNIFKALGLSAIVISLFGIFQWITGMGIPVPWDFEHRITSIFPYPNAVGLFLGPIVVIGASYLFKKFSWFWLGAAGLSFIGIILAQSEAAIVAVLATLLILGLSQKKTRKYTAGIFLVAILIIVALPVRNQVFQKLTLQDYSGQVRISQWQETWEMLKTKPFLGVGLSGYPQALEPFHKATPYEIFQYPHNIFLNFWTELGLLGLLGFFWLCFIVLSSRPRPLRLRSGQAPAERRDLESTRPLGSPRSLGMTRIMACYPLLEMFIHGLVDVPYFKNDLAILTWLLIAILVYDLSKTSHKQNN